MLDFVQIRAQTKTFGPKSERESVITIYPEFIVMRSNDLMTRGGAFYAVWDERTGFWSKDPSKVAEIVDEALRERLSSYPDGVSVEARYMNTYSTKKWDEFLSYCRSLPDMFVELDSRILFSNDEVSKEDYATKKLPYPMKPGSKEAYEELISTLYDPIERQKLEWAIGSVISGDSKKIQKFIVLYGTAGSGKSTALNIVQMLFEGYYNVFEAKALTSSGNSFALEMFRDNPLVSIQHDGDLSRIEDNTKLNSIVSHEEMVVNEKRKAQYVTYFQTFLFMGTNRPVKITDSKSGITRRLIDVKPSGRTVPFEKYQILMAQIKFELGAIASHCLKVYSDLGIDAYNRYKPLEMMGATNDFYNFMEDHYDIFKQADSTTLGNAWELYKTWSEYASIKYPMSKRAVKEELKEYFEDYAERAPSNGKDRPRNLYSHFLTDKFSYIPETGLPDPSSSIFLDLYSTVSIFDDEYADQPAQLATSEGTPSFKWSNVKTKLKDIDTTELHYVKLPENHVVIDFDISDENGEKDLQANLRAASKWPSTYAEISRSGNGVHLHYIYEGDVSKLASSYSKNVEIKTFKGNSALRRQLTRCNRSPIATLSSGLPLKKGGKKVLDFEGLKNEKALRTLIERNLKKEIHPGTKPSVDFIYKALEDAYASGMHYDVTDMRPAIMAFANNSTNHSLYCVKLASKMHFQSDDASEGSDWDTSGNLIFYDVEVFPNLFIVVWKNEGSDQCVRMINPTPKQIADLCKFKLVGFNNRRYDNHILYARLVGMSNHELYMVSKRIIGGGKEARNGYFNEAWNLSYADVYDYSSKKQSLKKWEIELGIHHQELGLPWDDPVDETLWDKVASYCENDVFATEAVFKATYDDFVARLLLSDLSGLRPNETTRKHGTKIIFGDDKNPQDKLVYTDLSEMFPGYTFDHGKSMYRGEDPGEGGYVYSEPGYYEDVALLDIASMHPTSLIQLNYLGPYTQRFEDLVNARLAIKHGDHDSARKMLDGKLAKYIDDPDISDKNLAFALKIIINSVYGWTCARFECEFRHPRNVDNIVAKRGALFMINLKHEVQERGFTVAHIKTDSIKIPNATKEIIDFVMDYGKQYGYTFEHEDTYDRMCLVNQAVYICHSETHYEEHGGWDATGAQFAVPYVFKSLFSKEPFEFSDYCETKTVTVGDIYLDMNEGLDDDDHDLRFVGRAGLFTPILPGRGGGLLYRVANEKLYAISGTKGFRWLESETVSVLSKEDDIDFSYYEKLCDDAVKTIEEYVPYEKLAGKERK